MYVIMGFWDLTASTWVNTTCRDIQTAIIKLCAFMYYLELCEKQCVLSHSNYSSVIIYYQLYDF